MASISSRIASVSPMVGCSREQGGVSTGTEHFSFSLFTKTDPSGKEGTKGVKSLHMAGSLFSIGGYLVPGGELSNLHLKSGAIMFAPLLEAGGESGSLQASFWFVVSPLDLHAYATIFNISELTTLLLTQIEKSIEI